jgi:hypothetical protein
LWLAYVYNYTLWNAKHKSIPNIFLSVIKPLHFNV